MELSLYKQAMIGLKRQASVALQGHDFEFLMLVAEELLALDACDSEYEYIDPLAQEWAYLANQE